MRGRVRLSIPTLSKEAPLAGVLADFLGQQAGVRQVRLNRRAANLVVTFDPAVLNAEALVGMITAYRPEPSRNRTLAGGAARPGSSPLCSMRAGAKSRWHWLPWP